ncbi:MAG TPA: coproporphyrinogen III oxidase family protein, partial [Treponemataceae bacterium]|nr:coproporphyrinogen III oxidase family protein [Treponemataceae bacterium]
MNSAGLYIHIPFCISKCSYCDFFSIPGTEIPDSYITRLIQEHEYRKNQANVLWSSVYVGGGTPSLLS